MKTPHLKTIGRSPLRLGFTLLTFALVCFALSPTARAACQEGCLTNQNTVLGDDALINNTTGHVNTANGASALLSNTTGFSNTAIGFQALVNNTNGNNNIALGYNAGLLLANDSDNIAIGNPGVAGQSNAIRIGTRGTHNATFIAGISGAPAAGGAAAVMIGSNGKLGTIASSERFKDNIQPMDKASEAILALHPVTFHYKKDLDPEAIPQFGLVAEQVEKVNPDLVARDDQGKPYTVRYDAVNAMLLNEFLKEHRKVERLEAAMAQQQKAIETLTASLKEQATQIQNVSAQQQVKERAPRLASAAN